MKSSNHPSFNIKYEDLVQPKYISRFVTYTILSDLSDPMRDPFLQWPHDPYSCVFRLTHWAPRKCSSIHKSVLYEHILRNKFIGISCEIALRLIPQNIFDD